MLLSTNPEDYEIANQLGLTKNKPPAKATKRKKHGAAALRKAPQAPKRFKSSYIMFFTAKRDEVKAELGGTPTVVEVSRRTAEKWRNISPEERAHWDQVAARDKQRYIVEKSTYTGPWRVPWKRTKRDPTAPKRPPSAFLNFSQKKRRPIKEQFPHLSNTDVSKKLGEMWRNASEEERAPYVAKEKAEREAYKIKRDAWQEEHDEKLEEQNKIEAEQTKEQSQASIVYNNPQQQIAQPSVANQYNYADPMSAIGYNSNMQQQQDLEQQYAGHQQQLQQTRQFYNYSFGTQGYSYGYPNPPAAPLYYGRQAVVLGPNGMPHYGSSSNTAFAANQETQPEPFEGGILQQQGSYDLGDQDVVKQET
eukprot:CAMPEP_0202483394 /NCGR_PEP_ID=MMETSP1361-20130828/2636_1 /ASSEMBLY_ACC=CAM_ASM_000849 /TAXON_ID=210615 /ORGANISM="Staurosira complex sp., Strain CCMP2646" /LENGTH=362 /DNA_ID=CAMNT_0049111621 /DNA_START=141 /DNA_END=1229 /DNA_ORIENTATION=-